MRAARCRRLRDVLVADRSAARLCRTLVSLSLLRALAEPCAACRPSSAGLRDLRRRPGAAFLAAFAAGASASAGCRLWRPSWARQPSSAWPPASRPARPWRASAFGGAFFASPSAWRRDLVVIMAAARAVDMAFLGLRSPPRAPRGSPSRSLISALSNRKSTTLSSNNGARSWAAAIGSLRTYSTNFCAVLRRYCWAACMISWFISCWLISTPFFWPISDSSRPRRTRRSAIAR